MENVIVFGTGNYYKEKEISIKENYNIICFADNDTKKHGIYYDNKMVIMPKEILEYEFDKILIMSSSFIEITRQLIEIGVNKDKIFLGINIKPFLQFEANIFKDNSIYFEINENGYIFANINGLRILLRDSNQVAILNEVYGDRTYQFDINYKNIVVIDIGMNVGMASLLFACKDNVKKVYGFEPVKETYELALNNFKMNELQSKKIRAYNYGLGDGEDEFEIFYDPINLGGSACCNKTSIEDSKKQNNLKKCSIQIKDASDEISKVMSGNAKCKFVCKIDCEGAENSIIKRLDEKNILENISLVIMEWHNEKKDEIIEKLKNKGFCVFTQYNDKLGDAEIGMIYAVNVGEYNE